MLSHKANHKNSNKNLKNSKNFQPNKLEQNISSESDFLKDQLFTEKNKDVIIVPSLSLDSHLLSEINGLIHYESRLLYNILSLRYQSNRLFYFSSIQIDPAIIDYYFELIKENLEDLQEAKNRFFLISVNDFRNNLCLSHKLLLRPNLLTHVASLLRKDDKSVASDLKVFRGTAYEEKIAEKFALDLNSTKGKDLDWGGKAGSRTIFKELNIPHIPGTYTAEKNLESFFKSIIDVLKNNPNAKKGIVKLDQGFSGKGNATMNVEETNKILHSTEDKEANVEKALVALKKAYLNLKFSCESETIENFTNSLKHLGAIFELFYDTRAKDPKLVTSPSVQVLIKNDLTVITLSTHEQILEGHCYTGCRYPCNEDYREELEKFGKKVGQFLAKKKIADYFSVDFMCDPPTSSEEKWDIKAIEINLRMTGTTHPYFLARNLIQSSDEVYDNEKLDNFTYISFDAIKDPDFKHLSTIDLIHLIKNNNLNWDPKTRKGCILINFGGISENGQFGITCISNTKKECDELYKKVLNVIKEEASRLKNEMDLFLFEGFKENFGC